MFKNTVLSYINLRNQMTRFTWATVVDFTLRAEPFFYRNRVKRWGEALHVIPMEQKGLKMSWVIRHLTNGFAGVKLTKTEPEFICENYLRHKKGYFITRLYLQWYQSHPASQPSQSKRRSSWSLPPHSSQLVCSRSTFTVSSWPSFIGFCTVIWMKQSSQMSHISNLSTQYKRI